MTIGRQSYSWHRSPLCWCHIRWNHEWGCGWFTLACFHGKKALIPFPPPSHYHHRSPLVCVCPMSFPLLLTGIDWTCVISARLGFSEGVAPLIAAIVGDDVTGSSSWHVCSHSHPISSMRVFSMASAYFEVSFATYWHIVSNQIGRDKSNVLYGIDRCHSS